MAAVVTVVRLIGAVGLTERLPVQIDSKLSRKISGICQQDFM